MERSVDTGEPGIKSNMPWTGRPVEISGRSRLTTHFTIGHSTRPLEEFIALLKGADVTLLVDVRSVPRSRANPQFNADTLPEALSAAGIGYRHMKSLGGLRGRQKGHETSPNTLWKNDGFRNYADYALTAEFHEGLESSRSLAREQTCAIMCAETLWWRCHRRIITDYLLAAGDEVVHILGPGGQFWGRDIYLLPKLDTASPQPKPERACG